MIMYQCDFCKKMVRADETYMITVGKSPIGKDSRSPEALVLDACPACRDTLAEVEGSKTPIGMIDFTSHTVKHIIPKKEQ